MKTRLLKTVVMLAFTAWSTLALADDPPSRVGRVAMSEGMVSISGREGESISGPLVNWPVSARDLITTARGARTELQIGSTFVRLDGDSSLEVTDLDDNNLALRLHYGSVSISIVNPEVLGGFELSTPEGSVRMQEPGRLRVDAERVRDTSSVSVFDGVALVQAGGASLNVRAGKRADLSEDNVSTTRAVPDSFDDWALARDNSQTATVSSRYVPAEMTGYADLDRYGSWQVSNDYGPIWIPSVAPGWVPYSDGRWAWIDPWGWTWVDNAPWGYAPFHYGRWVSLGGRWCWAPGWRDVRPAWAPALVGWVGGAGVSIYAGSRHDRVPAQGWFPLTPRDRFEPAYGASNDYMRRLNRYAKPYERREWERHREGVTVVPHDSFARRGQVVVSREPRVAMPMPALQTVPGAAPPPPAGWRQRRDERGDGRRWTERGGERGQERRGPGFAPQPALSAQPHSHVPVLTAPSVVPAQPAQPRQPVLPDVPSSRPPATVAAPTPHWQSQRPEPREPFVPQVPPPRPVSPLIPATVPNMPPPRPVSPLIPATVPPAQPQPQGQPGWRGDRHGQVDEGRRGERSGRWGGGEGMRRDSPAAPAPAPAPTPAAVAPPPAPAQAEAPARPMPMHRNAAQRAVDANVHGQER